ncbi:uncharacterized protein FYW61_014414 isoform 2-T2 [Anableps anableps]
MRSAALFLLMFCCSVGDSRSEVSGPADDRTRTEARTLGDLSIIWNEVQELKELFLSLKGEEVEQQQQLQSVESRLRDGEMVVELQKQSMDELQMAVDLQIDKLRRNLLTEQSSGLRKKVEELEAQSKAQAAEILELQARINSSESSVEILKKKDAVLAAELPFLQTRLRASESTMEQLRRKDAEIQASNSSAEIVSEVVVLESHLEIHLDKLKANIEGQIHELENKLNSSQLLLEEPSAAAAKLFAAEYRLDEAERQQDKLRKYNTELESRLGSSEKQLEHLKTLNTVMEIRLRSTERQLDQLKNHSAGLEVRLRVSERQLEEQKTGNSVNIQVQLKSTEAQLVQLKNHTAVLEMRLRVGEKHLEDLKTENSELVSRLRSSEKQLEDLKTANTELVSKLRSKEKQMEDLKTRNTDTEVRLGSTEEQLDQLENQTAELVSRLRSGEKQLEDLKIINSELVSRLRSSEKQLEDLKTANTDMEVRFGSTERQLDQLKNHSAGLEVRLRVSERQLEEQKTGNSEFEAQLSAVTFRLNLTKEHLDDLKKQSLARAAELASLSERLTAALGNTEDELKVAFSAGLTDAGIVGPFDEETTLTFSKTITNIGQGYNSSAGVFTAPIRGLYFFSFTAADYLKGYMGLYLYRNEQPIIFSLDLNDHGGYTSMTSAVALQLDEGDQVRLALPASYRLYDDSRNFSVFSGFLLFPV